MRLENPETYDKKRLEYSGNSYQNVQGNCRKEGYLYSSFPVALPIHFFCYEESFIIFYLRVVLLGPVITCYFI